MRLHHALPHQLQRAIDEKWPLLIPTGCIEYHGPHLALGLDTILVEELLQRVAQSVDALVAPPLWYGPTGYAVSGPDQGTVDVSIARFGRHVKDVLSSFWDMGFDRIIVGVHHQGIDGPESLAIRQAAAEIVFEKAGVDRGRGWWGAAPPVPGDRLFGRIQVWPLALPAVLEQGAFKPDHAGFTETTLLLAARPELVEMDRLGPDAPWFSLRPESDARKATVEDGERMWKTIVDAWVEKLTN